MAIEEHVLNEVGKQLDYYVDAYRKVHDIDLRLAEEYEIVAELNAERSEAEMLRDAASDAVNSIIENIAVEDEGEVRSLVSEKLSPLIGLMVL